MTEGQDPGPYFDEAGIDVLWVIFGGREGEFYPAVVDWEKREAGVHGEG